MNWRYYRSLPLICFLMCLKPFFGCKSPQRDPVTTAKLLKEKMTVSGYECRVDQVHAAGGSLYFVPIMPEGEYPQPGSGRRYHVNDSGEAILIE